MPGPPPPFSRRSILEQFADNTAVIDELLAYNENTFCFDDTEDGLALPLNSEGHIPDWANYISQSKTEGLHTILQRIFPALLFPIAEGMSQDPELKACRTRGIIPDNLEKGCRFQAPEQIEFFMHASLAGEVPVILLPDRRDFETLVRSVLHKNEPTAIPPSMGAAMVAGYNNWDRIRKIKSKWLEAYTGDKPSEAWNIYFRHRVVPEKHSYQDRFILLSRGPYSDIPARDMGLEEEEWLDLSTTIRLEHECAHYLTKRALGCMRENIFDELLADYAGLVAAFGEFRSDWFLRFVGLEDPDTYRAGGRLENYRGNPALSDEAFLVLGKLVRRAARAVEKGGLSNPRSAGKTAGECILQLSRETLESLNSTP